MKGRRSGGFLVAVPADLARFWRERVHRRVPLRERRLWRARLLVSLQELVVLTRDRPAELPERLGRVGAAGGPMVRLHLWFNRQTYPRVRRLVGRIQAACGLPMAQVFWLALDGLRAAAGGPGVPAAPVADRTAPGTSEDLRGLVVALLTDEDEAGTG